MELLPVSIGLGLAVSLLFSELFGLAAGGMVVPGYIALYLNKPFDVLATVLMGIATYMIVHALSTTTVIYGKRRTVVMILVGYVLGMSLGAILAGHFVGAYRHFSGLGDFTIIGYIIPGLIAIWIDRQGLIETVSTLLTAAVVVRLLLILSFGAEVHP